MKNTTDVKESQNFNNYTVATWGTAVKELDASPCSVAMTYKEKFASWHKCYENSSNVRRFLNI
jgi:hypothetical protein